MTLTLRVRGLELVSFTAVFRLVKLRPKTAAKETRLDVRASLFDSRLEPVVDKVN